MNEARLKILTMLSEKKISVEEAERLLKALEPETKPKGVGEMFRDIGRSFQRIPQTEAAQIMADVVEQVKDTVGSIGSVLEGTDKDQQLQIMPGTDLKVHHGGGHLLLHATEEDQLILSGARRGCSMDSANNRVVVNSGGNNLAVGVPANVTTLAVSAGGGNVSVRGLTLQHLHAKAAGGHLTLDEVHVTELRLSSMGGHIDLRKIQSASIGARAIGGNITLQLSPEGEAHVDLHSVGGNLELYLPAECMFRVDAETLGGRFSTEFELQDYKSHGGHTEGRVGVSDVQLQLRTTGGNIRIRKS